MKMLSPRRALIGLAMQMAVFAGGWFASSTAAVFPVEGVWICDPAKNISRDKPEDPLWSKSNVVYEFSKEVVEGKGVGIVAVWWEVDGKKISAVAEWNAEVKDGKKRLTLHFGTPKALRKPGAKKEDEKTVKVVLQLIKHDKGREMRFLVESTEGDWIPSLFKAVKENESAYLRSLSVLSFTPGGMTGDLLDESDTETGEKLGGLASKWTSPHVAWSLANDRTFTAEIGPAESKAILRGTWSVQTEGGQSRLVLSFETPEKLLKSGGKPKDEKLVLLALRCSKDEIKFDVEQSKGDWIPGLFKASNKASNDRFFSIMIFKKVK
ncbi:MAG: hypothetical protein K8R36_22840 [Planctomycetales bacterium]|nr:hypothetical protein [Planctomycetales bacterium]